MNSPDVSVVVPVYNTMPYLRKCLSSLVGQSIGLDRMQIILVDDGSTDGSGRQVDRLARRYPDAVRVVRQANSGGPAAPCNRGLEVATGRYVFFVGADDYLGPDALRRLVAAADAYGSDVVLGRVVGVNGRHLFQEIFASSQVDVDLFESALPWALANTKLFRRELIERHRLRFPTDMPVLSDQPFTIEACYRAQRISVLADYDYYHAVRRINASNITYRSQPVERLHCIQRLVNRVADLVQPGKQRDLLLARHFGLELAGLLRDDFRHLDRETQQRIHAGVRLLVRQYLTDNLRDLLGIEARLRLCLAGAGSLDDLLAVIEQDAERGAPASLVEGGRWYAEYPGVDAATTPSPNSWRDVTTARADWLARLNAASATWTGSRVLSITAHSPHPRLAQLPAESIQITAGDLPGTTCDIGSGTNGSTVRVQFSVAALLAGSAASGQRHALRSSLSTLAMTGAAPLRAARLAPGRPVLCRRGTRIYLLSTVRDPSGQLVVAVAPITVARVTARLRQRLRPPRRTQVSR